MKYNGKWNASYNGLSVLSSVTLSWKESQHFLIQHNTSLSSILLFTQRKNVLQNFPKMIRQFLFLRDKVIRCSNLYYYYYHYQSCTFGRENTIIKREKGKQIYPTIVDSHVSWWLIGWFVESMHRNKNSWKNILSQ